MENFVNRAAGALSEALAGVQPVVAFAVCAALAIVALIAQMVAAKATTSAIGDCRRVKKFVVKRGEVVSSNAHKFYKKCVSHMGRRVRRAWKKHALCGREYAGSALKFEMDRYLGKERKIPSLYIPCAFAAVTLLQTLMLCKGYEWSLAVAYAIGAGAVWAVFAIPAWAYCVARRNAARASTARLAEMLNAKLTLRPAEGRLLVLPADAAAVTVRPRSEKKRTIADAVSEYLASEPDKEVAKVVLDGVQKAGNCGCGSAEEVSALSSAADKLKKYTA